jgi:S1-C subfamily serine protease
MGVNTQNPLNKTPPRQRKAAIVTASVVLFIVVCFVILGRVGLTDRHPAETRPIMSPQTQSTVNGSASIGPNQPKSPRQIAEDAFPSVVLVVIEVNDSQSKLGSGFVLRDGLVVTNYHVIRNGQRGYCGLVGKQMKYEIAGAVAVDVAHDLSIIAVNGLKSPALPIGDSGQVGIGDAVYAIGNPEGLEGTFSQGMVSGLRHNGNDMLLQITAPISQGSSGGPILDSSGKVIAIAVASFREGQNLNLAIPSSYLTKLAGEVSGEVLPLWIAGRTDPGLR